jgi:hypothetical protein
MVKATLRSAVLLWVAAMSLLVAGTPGFAEVQNVRVGGDVTVRAFWREHLDLHQEGCNTGSCQTEDTSGAGSTPLEDDAFLMSTTGVNIGADLTENVSAFIRLANERDWNQDGGATGDFDLSQSYITLKEFFYSPLTLRIGTQPIVWGRGLVLGSSMLPNTLTGIGAGNDRNTAITPNEYTDFTAFDAFRGTLDLSGVTGNVPLTADFVYIKLDEATAGVPDDRNVIGVNLSSKLDAWNSEVEAYFLNRRDKNGVSPNVDKDGSNNTWGLRGSTQPAEGALIYGEVAYQNGTRTPTYDLETASNGVRVGDAQQAWLFNLGVDYTLADVAMTPKIGAEWIFYSGKVVDGNAFSGWLPIAPSYFPTLIRSFQTASTGVGLYPVDQTGVTSAFTNQQELAFHYSLKPVEDLSFGQRLSFFWADEGITPVTAGSGPTEKVDSHLGTEWDTRVSYAYTDDVILGLDYGVLFPGNVFKRADIAASGRNTAQQLVTTVSVKF